MRIFNEKKKTVAELEMERIGALIEAQYDHNSAEYKKLCELYKYWNEIYLASTSGVDRLSKDAQAQIIAYLAGLGIVVGAEAFGHIFRSKAVSLLAKIRV